MSVDSSAEKDILIAAHRAVEEADLPPELKEVAFAKAVDLLAARAGLAVSPSAPVAEVSLAAEAAGTADKSLERIAAKLKLDGDGVGETFHIDGDDLKLSLAASRFAQQDTKATREIALLVAAGRQAGGWDAAWTPTTTIRQVCDDYGKLDEGNFAKTINGMDEVFSYSGGSRDKRVKVNRKGYEEATALIRKLTGGDAE
jgi:hypothetical protein